MSETLTALCVFETLAPETLAALPVCVRCASQPPSASRHSRGALFPPSARVRVPPSRAQPWDPPTCGRCALHDAICSLNGAKRSLNGAKRSLNDAKLSLNDAKLSLNDADRSLNDANCSLNDAKRSLHYCQLFPEQ